jgi:hypothetical protein
MGMGCRPGTSFTGCFRAIDAFPRDMTSWMDAPLASLIGAVIGGGIASGSNLAVERHRDGRERSREKMRGDAELRRAARPLAEELLYGRDLIEKAVERDYFTWEPPKRELPASAWAEHRGVVAERGSTEDWRAVGAAYKEIDRLNWVVRDAIEEEGWTQRQMRAPWEGPALVPAAELGKSLELIDRAVARLPTFEMEEDRDDG